jgi:hypothetical protein
MGSTLEQICGFLASEELQYRIDTERGVIVTGFGTENYIDDAGDKNLGMIIQLEENGEFLKIFTPKCYSVLEETNRAALMQTLLMVSWKTKMIQFEYDDTDGEVRAIIEYPLEDADLTRRQLLRSVQALVQIVDKYHPVMFKALREGVIEFEASENPLEELQNAFSRFEETLREMGIDVEEILEESVQESDTETNNRDAEGEDPDDDDEYI